MTGIQLPLPDIGMSPLFCVVDLAKKQKVRQSSPVTFETMSKAADAALVDKKQKELEEVYKTKELDILSWISSELSEPLKGDLFASLLDGTVLCRLMLRHNPGTMLVCVLLTGA